MKKQEGINMKEINLNGKHLINKELLFIERVPDNHSDRMNNGPYFNEDEVYVAGTYGGYHLRLVFKDKSEVWITGSKDQGPNVFEVMYNKYEAV